MPELMIVESDANVSRSQSYIVRVWLENLGEGKSEWRGKVQSVEGGQVFYFRDWQVLITHLQTLLEKANPMPPSDELNPTPPE